MKTLPDDDFRSRRFVLEPNDFALGPDEPDGPACDLIDQETWRSITSLQDDVSVRTSNEHGSSLKKMWGFWSEWSCVVGALQELTTNVAKSPLCTVACDAGDEFQSSICNALVGFYRVAFSCLRNILENMSIGLELELRANPTLFESWLNGGAELGFGWAADLLPSNARVRVIEAHCLKSCGDSFFRQRNPPDNGGLARRLFKRLSKFTHGAPGFTDGDVRNSNGPIFVPGIFLNWEICFRMTYAIALFEAKIGQPRLARLAYDSELTAGKLFQQVTSGLTGTEDGTRVLKSLAVAFW
jgi:hypothetical protein